jgi:xanthine dehydrogenase YagR molybdenum-binding subunit
MAEQFFGSAQRRVDGRLKVTGGATYSAEFITPDLAHGYVVCSTVARGRITAMHIEEAERFPGVIAVITHENRRRTAWFDSKWQDMVAPPGAPFRPLYSDQVIYSGQPIALVVAEDFEAARDAASLVRVEYAIEAHETDLRAARGTAHEPRQKRSGIAPAPPPRGDANGALQTADIRVGGEFGIASEFHQPMEPHATTVIWEGDGRITVHDKIQGVDNSFQYVTNVFGLAKDDVRVVSPFVGGGFGAGLRPQYQLFLAVLAALQLERSVRVELTRDQMFTHVFRPHTSQVIALGASRDGKLQAITHEAVAVTSRFEDHQEVVVNWSGMLYHCDNVALTYKVVQLDTYTPGDMRAPGAPLGLFALESAMDELSYATGIDPVELRLRNYTEADENEGKTYSSKALREAYQQGAERFGWARRNPKPRSMREGRDLVGWGMATGVWESQLMETSARATLSRDGTLTIASATADIGTGTYTILTQVAADALGLPMDRVTVCIGDSNLPKSPVQGGSWTAASAGSAVQAACYAVREQLVAMARGADNSPLANADVEHVVFRDGRVAMANDLSRSMTFEAVLAAGGVDKLEAEQTASPDEKVAKQYAGYTHSAVFVEVRVDEELGVARVTRVVDAVAAGKIINPKTARSQIIGGVVFGIGMALHEEALTDHTLGRVMNHNLAEYHVPVNADIPEIEVIFVDEVEDKLNPLGVKGLGEIGIVGTAGAIANAIFHATGKRMRDLPITIDKVLRAAA